MAVKLSSLTLSKKIPKWVHPSVRFFSVSCANHTQTYPENEHESLNTIDFEAKIQFLRKKLSPDTLIRVLDSTNDLGSALNIFKWASLQKRFCHTIDTYFWIILKLGFAGNLHEMEGFCTEMVRERCPGVENASVALIESFIRHGRVSEAIRVLVALNSGDYKPSVDLFNLVLGAIMEEKRDFLAVLFIYKEMVKAGIVPSVDTLNYLLEVLLEMDLAGFALDQFRRMSKKGCSPNSRTFETMISGLIVRNQVDESILILHEMFEADCKPDVRFYTCTIPVLCKINKLEEGVKLFRMMIASKIMPDSLLCDVLFFFLCDNSWMDDATNLLEEVIENGVTVTVDAFVNMIRGFCKLGRFSDATKFLEEKHIFETAPYNVLLDGYCNAGDFVKAQSILQKMFERNIANDDSWNILIRWLCENLRIKKAFELLTRMIVTSVIPDCATYSALILGYCKVSRHEDAIVLFQLLCSRCWLLDSVAYAKLVEGLCQVEKFGEATEVFCFMSSNGCSLQSSSFNLLIKGVCVTGEVDKAIRLLQLARYSCTSCTSTTYNTIMLGLSEAGKANDLLVVLSNMLVDGSDLDEKTYCILLQSMSSQSRSKDCALFFNMMVSEGFAPDSKTLALLLVCLAKHAQLHMILSAIKKLDPSFEIFDSAMYNMLVNGLWKEGYKSEARQLLDLMLEKDWIPDAMTHQVLIGSVVQEETEWKKLTFENSIAQDEVSSILAEGLGKM